MNSPTKDSNQLRTDKSPQSAAAGTKDEILLNRLLEQEPTGFILRSLYGKDDSPSQITKKILNILHLKKKPGESELLESLLSAASQIPAESKGIDDPITFKVLVKLQKYKIMELLDTNKKTVSVYLPDGAYREQMGGSLNQLRDINYNALTFVGTLCRDKHEEGNWVYYGGHGIIQQMDFVDLYICATYAHDFPKSSKKIYFMHDIHDSPVSNEDDVLRMIGEFDYYFAPSPSVLERIQKQITQARDGGYLKEKREIGLIPGGYIKLDQNLKLFEKYKKEEKILIHAPTVVDADFEEYACLPRHSEAIIGALLENFPDYKIIFRPHPHTAESPPARRIAEKHKTNPRFVFDDNPSFYMNNYAQSALMVTDFSGTAFTYAFTTLRPVIFYSHNEITFQKLFKGFKFVEDRNKIGAVAQNIDEMVKGIRLFLNSKGAMESGIKGFRNSLLYNLGQAEAYFAENIDHILNDQKHSDWRYIQADPIPPRLLEEGYKGFNIIYFKSRYIAVSQKLGTINLENVIESDTDLDFEYFIASSEAEARGYIDGINQSLQLIEQSRGSRQKIKRLEKIISEGDIKEKKLIKELDDREAFMEQWRLEARELENQAKSLETELESRQREIKTLNNKLAEKNLKIEELTRQAQNSNSKKDILLRELELRDKWMHLLREKLKTAASQRDGLQKELKNIKSSFWYRFIK